MNCVFTGFPRISRAPHQRPPVLAEGDNSPCRSCGEPARPLVACGVSQEDAPIVRRLIFALVGAVLFGAATFFYGLILFPNGLDWLTLRQFAIGLVVFGTTTGALLGLIAAWVSGPSDKHRTQFLVVGTVVGLLTGLVYGLNTDEVDVTVSMHTVGPGYPFLWWVFTPLILRYRLDPHGRGRRRHLGCHRCPLHAGHASPDFRNAGSQPPRRDPLAGGSHGDHPHSHPTTS